MMTVMIIFTQQQDCEKKVLINFLHKEATYVGASITITKYMYMWLKIYQRISKVVKSLILIKVILMLSIVLLSKVMVMDIFTEPLS